MPHTSQGRAYGSLRYWVCLTVLMGAANPAPAGAASPTLPAAAAQVSFQCDSVGSFGTFNDDCFAPGVSDTASGSAYYLGGSAEAESLGNVSSGAGSAAVTVGYYFEVIGPSGARALLDFTASGATATSGTAKATALAEWGTTVLLEANSCSGSLFTCDANYGNSFSGTATLSVPTNTPELLKVVVTGTSGTTPGSWGAYLDPQLTLDATDATGLSIVFSADPAGGTYPPLTPIPLPLPWGLLLSGLGGLGMLARRCRQ